MKCLFLSPDMSLTEFITFILIGLGLSFDSFAVSVSFGLMKRDIEFKQAVLIAITFAVFQAFFPLAGWLIGEAIKELLDTSAHWIGFALLCLIGGKMLWESKKEDSPLKTSNPFQISLILGLAIATSIDALVVGLSFGVLDMPILFPVIIIGMITFLASMLGMLFGKKISTKRSHQALFAGGIILILIGIKVLIENLYF